MKLLQLVVEQFRCFKAPLVVEFADLTALIGRNDAGKSSIMDALDIFLNDGVPDKDDATKGTDGRDLSITCVFTPREGGIVIDDSVPTTLKQEFLLNVDGTLEIKKTFSGNLSNPKCNGIFACCLHPTEEGVADLLQLKQKELKARAKELGVDLSGVDQKVNAQLRQAIRDHVGSLSPKPTFVPLIENNAKDIWTGLKAHLPSFALFKSDRVSTDQDAEAQDPLKAAVKEALKAKESELNAIALHVENEVRKTANLTLEKLRQMDSTLASELNPQFASPKWDGLFKASFSADNGIPINKRGSGVRRLVLLNFFRAKAEQQAHSTGVSNIIYGIEEPETSQHPDNQRLLLRALAELSAESQVVFTTHTPMLARATPLNNLRYIQVGDDGARQVLVGSDETHKLCAKALGVLPDNGVKMFLGVEGPNDISFLRNISAALRQDGVDIPDLERLEIGGEIIFFPLGGSTLALWTSRLQNLERPEFHLYDRDNPEPDLPKYDEQVNAVNARDRCKARSTAMKEMENYVHPDCIREAYAKNGMTIALPDAFGAFDDVPLLVAKAVHDSSPSEVDWNALDQESQREKIGKAKKMINAHASRLMTRALLTEVDPDGDVLAWFADIGQLLSSEN